MNKKQTYTLLAILFGVLIILGLFLRLQSDTIQKLGTTIKIGDFSFPNDVNHTIPLESLISGGPGKDDIPALTNPKFVSLEKATVPDDTLGILVSFNGEYRYYPYNIMVWHEIVNDHIGKNYFAVTFCPLCGSAIVFDRHINGDLLEFGVSGLLFESNLVMYDKQTESFWSQAKGESIVGEMAGTKLEVLQMQLIEFAELLQKYPNAKVLSSDTGYIRNYFINPYSNYEQNDQLISSISVRDERFPLKEVMYIIPFKDKSIAVQQLNLQNGQTYTMNVNNSTIVLIRNGDEITARANGKTLPGYYEMWFSWAIHHQDNGVIWRIN